MKPVSSLILAQKQQNPKEAQKLYLKHFSDHPFDDKAQLSYIRLLAKEKKFQPLQRWINEAKKSYNQKIQDNQQANSLTKNYTEKLFNIMVDFCYQKYNHDPELGNTIEKFLQVRKDAQTKNYDLPPKFYFKMGNIYEIRQQREMAMQCYEKILVVSPQYFHVPYIKWYRRSLQSASAKSQIEDLIRDRIHGGKTQTNREELDQLYCDFGRLFMAADNFDKKEAESYFQMARQRNQLDKQVHHRINKYQQQLKNLHQSWMAETERMNEQSIQIISKKQMLEIQVKKPHKNNNQVILGFRCCSKSCVIM